MHLEIWIHGLSGWGLFVRAPTEPTREPRRQEVSKPARTADPRTDPEWPAKRRSLRSSEARAFEMTAQAAAAATRTRGREADILHSFISNLCREGGIPDRLARIASIGVGSGAESSPPDDSPAQLVPEEGVEPSCPCERGILSPLCLPFHHSGGGSADHTHNRLPFRRARPNRSSGMLRLPGAPQPCEQLRRRESFGGVTIHPRPKRSMGHLTCSRRGKAGKFEGKGSRTPLSVSDPRARRFRTLLQIFFPLGL